jgi:FG-GAP-like repeat/Viral BACON domain
LPTRPSRTRPSLVVLLALLWALAVVASPAAHAATFTVINNDGPGEGFNDPTPVAPVGGNLGTTLGAQRLIAFQRAAGIWGALLSSAVTIRVSATFDPLACNATSAILGSAGPLTAFRDFGGALVGSTWYPSALANALHGTDLDGSNDINAQFNSALGTTCAFPRGWYYGLDGNAGGNIDFVTVLLHELGHGLGFITLVNLTSGAKALGLNDAFMLNLENHGASPSDYPSMTDAQRVAASTNTGNLHWVGAHVRAASGVLVAGKVGDHVRMFAPNPQQPGSSVAHWDTALAPDQLMEPMYTVPLDPTLELALFQDIGWTLLQVSGTPTLQVTPGTSVAAAGSQGGPFSPSAFQYQLSATSGSVNFSISGMPSWLTVSATSGTVTTSPTTVTFTVNASANGLAAATYGPATVTFTNTTNGQGNTTRTATLTVNPPSALQVTPATTIAASGIQGGPFSPSAFQYQLSTTTGVAGFSISGLPSWLTASATSGTVTTSATTITFTVNASANTLVPGVYGPTTITFANTTNGLGNTTRAATLTVNVPVPTLVVTPAGNVTAGGPKGGPFSPSSFQYQLSMTTGSANFSISGLPSWLTASATSGTATTSATTITLTVNASAITLVPGVYGPATITFTNTTNGQGNTARTAILTVGRAVGDFDGDARRDFAVYRPTTAEWFISGGATGFQTRVFGAPSASGLGDIPIPADFDGDGKTDLAIYRQTTGEWFIFGSATGFKTLVFGAPSASGLGDTPVPADYDGDGKADLAIYRKATGEWFIFGSATGFRTLAFGAPAVSGLGDTPVPADYDGDGKADLAVYRKATGEWFIFGSATGFRTLAFGAPAASGLGDTPVPADFDGDRKTDVAVYRKATGEWFIFGSATGFWTLTFGAPAASGLGDTPVPGDFDGDGKADIAVRRSATAEWFVLQSLSGQLQTVTFGAPSDLPLPQPPQ